MVWPDAPLLYGITRQLLEQSLPELGLSSRRATVHLRDISSFEGAFLSYARGIAVVTGVDDVRLPERTEHLKTLADAYASMPWDRF